MEYYLRKFAGNKTLSNEVSGSHEWVLGDKRKSEVWTQAKQLDFMLCEDTAEIVIILKNWGRIILKVFLFQNGNDLKILKIIQIKVLCTLFVIFSEFFRRYIEVNRRYLVLFECYPHFRFRIHVNSLNVCWIYQTDCIAILNIVWWITCNLSFCQFKVYNIVSRIGWVQ